MARGLVLVVSAPSGAGKSTLCRALAERRADVRLSVSCTTRAPRPTETEGRDYHFISEAEFVRRKDRGDFLEWARVHGHCYGTPRAPLDEQRDGGLHVLMDIDTQGAFAVRNTVADCVLVFLAPPSWEELEDRLKRRNQDDDDTIRRRLTNARHELAQASRYDYCVVNDTLEHALLDVDAILRAESRRTARLPLEMAAMMEWGPAGHMGPDMRLEEDAGD